MQLSIRPPPGHQVQSALIRNPFTEQTVLDEKVCILDIKATDQLGRQFNVEMQMTTPPHLPQRITNYWAKIYSGQLTQGEDYDLLRPVISICFLDGVLYHRIDRCDLHFQIRELHNPDLLFTDHLNFYVFQLPLFHTSASDLQKPLEKWLYFLNNAMSMEADDLPDTLHEPEYQEAARALTVLTQSEIEHERYLARERARLDRLSFERTMERQVQKAEQAEQEAERLKKLLEQQLEQAKQESQQQLEQAKQESQQQLEQATARHTEGLIGQIQMCERLLQQTISPETELKTKSLDELQKLIEEMRTKLLG